MYQGKRLRLREWRLFRFLNQKQLAEKAGIARQTVMVLESADTESEVRPTTIQKLAAALAVEPGDLFRLPPTREEGNNR